MLWHNGAEGMQSSILAQTLTPNLYGKVGWAHISPRNRSTFFSRSPSRWLEETFAATCTPKDNAVQAEVTVSSIRQDLNWESRTNTLGNHRSSLAGLSDHTGLTELPWKIATQSHRTRPSSGSDSRALRDSARVPTCFWSSGYEIMLAGVYATESRTLSMTKCGKMHVNMR